MTGNIARNPKTCAHKHGKALYDLADADGVMQAKGLTHQVAHCQCDCKVEAVYSEHILSNHVHSQVLTQEGCYHNCLLRPCHGTRLVQQGKPHLSRQVQYTD